jgi:hypothetical protein
VINYLTGAALVASSFFFKFTPTVDIRTSQQIWYAFFMMIIVFYTGKTKFKREDMAVLYFIPASFFLSQHFLSSYTFHQWLLTSLGIFTYLKLKNTSLNREFLYKLLSFACLTQSFWLLLDYSNVDLYGEFIGLVYDNVQKITDTGTKWEVTEYKAVTGSLGHPTLSGAYVAALLPFVYKQQKYLTPLPVIALYLTASSMSIVSAYVGVLYFLTAKLKYRAYIWVSHIIACAGLLYYGNSHGGFFNDSARLVNWRELISRYWYKSPWFGNGPGYIETLMFRLHRNAEIFRPEHNEILTVFFQYGFVGLAVLAFYAKFQVVQFKKENDVYFKAALLALLFNCLGSFPLHIASLNFIFIILLSQLNKETPWQQQ